MSIETKIHPTEPFDKKAYHTALVRYDVALRASHIRIDDARALAESLQHDTSLLQQSLGTPEFPQTFQLLERLSNARWTPSNSDFVNAVPTFAQNVLQVLQEHIDDEPDVYLLPAYTLGRAFSGKQNSGFQAIATNIFSTNIEQLVESSEFTSSDAEAVVRHLRTNADASQITKLARAAVTKDSALTRRFPRAVDAILSLSILGTNTYDRPERMSAVLDEITNGHAGEVLAAWDASDGKKENLSKGSHAVYFENFGIVCQLEKRRPGITKLLIEEYGIMSFGRYPLDLLIEQHDSHHDKNNPYGIIITARDDHNGAIYSHKDQMAYAHAQSKASDMGFRVYETKHSEDIDEALQIIPKSAELHGELSYALLTAHGLDARLSKLGDIRKYFKKDAQVGLISCSTGEVGGTALQLSIALRDIDIHAPDYTAYLKDEGIQFQRVNGEFQLKVLFGYGEGNYNTLEDQFYAGHDQVASQLLQRTGVENHYDVATRVYRNGRLTRDYVK